MEFQKQTITIQQTPGSMEVEAMVAVGIGLAYHHGISYDGQELEKYVVSHVASGYSVVGDYRKNIPSWFPSEDAARRFIVVIQGLCDWNLSSDDLWKLDRASLSTAIARAYHQVLEELRLAQAS